MRPIDKLGFGPKYESRECANGDVVVRVTPPKWAGVGDGTTIILTADQYQRFLKWRNDGGLIQNALPELTKERREILQSGIGPQKWDELYERD